MFIFLTIIRSKKSTANTVTISTERINRNIWASQKVCTVNQCNCQVTRWTYACELRSTTPEAKAHKQTTKNDQTLNWIRFAYIYCWIYWTATHKCRSNWLCFVLHYISNMCCSKEFNANRCTVFTYSNIFNTDVQQSSSICNMWLPIAELADTIM